MKKMQCEVCGSTDIKKVDNSIFECQSCGVQYSKEEVQKLLVEITGSVKIDHSEEVANAVKRGEQFENAGNAQKAEEYYNKALDMDADNEEIQRRAQNVANLQEVEKYYIIDPDIDPEQNIKDFFKQLATTDNMACDIYKEIAIKSVTESYRPFYLIKMRCEYTWSAVSCHKYYEEQTVYETVYRNGRNYKEPRTKKVERIERVPRNGTYTHSGERFCVASQAIHNSFQIDDTDLKNAVIQDFEKLQYEKYSSCAVNRIDISLLEKKDEKYLYKGFELDLNTDSGVYAQKCDQLGEQITDEANASIQSSVGGDFFENYRMSGKVAAQSVIKVLVPVQVIEYTYKDKTYAAVSDLLSHTTTMPMIYPCDVELADAMGNLEAQKERASKSLGIISGLVIMGIGFLCLLFGMILPGTEGFFMPLMLVLTAAGLLAMLIGALVQGSREKKFQKSAEDVKIALFNPRVASLEAGRDRFFEQYTDYASAKAAAADVDCMGIRSIRPELSGAGALRKKMAYVTAAEVETDDTEDTLQWGIKDYKRKRKHRICLSLFGGITLGVIGLLVLLNEFGVWHYTVWGVSVLMIVGGFGMALIGSIVIMGNINGEIISLQNCLAMYRRQKALESEFEQPEQAPLLPILQQWTPERISQKAAELAKIKQTAEAKKDKCQNKTLFQKIAAWLKDHKKSCIVLTSIVVGLVIAIVAEVIAVNVMVHPYEESLHGKSFAYTEYDSDWQSDREYKEVKTYRFSNDGTYACTWAEIYTHNNEQKWDNEYNGTYKVRFELFSGEPRLIFNKYSDCEVQTDEKGEISAFEEYGDQYRIVESNDETGNFTDSNSVLNTDTSNSNYNSTIDSTSSITVSTESDKSNNVTSSATNNPIQNNTSTPSKHNASTTAKPHSSTQTTSKPTVNKDPCTDGHSWKAATCTSPAICAVCGATKGSATGHIWKDATCTEPATCTTCQKTSGEAKGHSINVAKCQLCGCSDFSMLAKSYSDVAAYDSKTGADYEVTNVSINKSGVLTFTFMGKTYSVTLYQRNETHNWNSIDAEFDCYRDGILITDAKANMRIQENNTYTFHFYWDYLEGCELYFTMRG